MASWQSCITGAAENILPTVKTNSWRSPGASATKPLVYLLAGLRTTRLPGSAQCPPGPARSSPAQPTLPDEQPNPQKYSFPRLSSRVLAPVGTSCLHALPFLEPGRTPRPCLLVLSIHPSLGSLSKPPWDCSVHPLS